MAVHFRGPQPVVGILAEKPQGSYRTESFVVPSGGSVVLRGVKGLTVGVASLGFRIDRALQTQSMRNGDLLRQLGTRLG